MFHQIFIQSKIPDTRAASRKRKILAINPLWKIDDVQIVDVYTIDKNFDHKAMQKIGTMLADTVTQEFAVSPSPVLRTPSPHGGEGRGEGGFNWAIEIGFLPGVTDNIAHTAKEGIEDLLKIKFEEGEGVYSSQLTFIAGKLSRDQAQSIATSLANKLIQRISIKSAEEFKRDGGMGCLVPRVSLHERQEVDQISLNVTDQELERLGRQGIANPDGSRRGPLSLGLAELKVIREYYSSHSPIPLSSRGGVRLPTDVELEMLAQTWSEHCKHTIFAAEIDDIKDGLYKHYIKAATERVRKEKGKKDICVSVFKDNSGGIVFDNEWVVTHKVETHNSPSALDPFGGAITGIVGVNRDTVGFGKGAKPVANCYGFCFGEPDDVRPLYRDAACTDQMLLPKRIMDGVIDGVREGGNCSGIPTPQGFVYFDERYRGKPLVFVGTVGLIPKKINGEPSFEKCACPGDLIVMVGGRVGKDGIHGATFSSEALTQGSPATAVQIGDPITQKKFSDAIVKEARDLGLYNSITDNGAGGLSSSIGEMARESGGCVVNLEKIPLKYPGLAPWEIWISESQERMSVAVPPENVKAFIDLMNRRGVEATVIGEFTNSGRCVVKYHGETAVDLELEFLHEGLPKKKLSSCPSPRPSPPWGEGVRRTGEGERLLATLAHPNHSSFAFITHQFDHEVQASSVLKPLQGLGLVNASATIIQPVQGNSHGVVLSQALYPNLSETDPYAMAKITINSAIRNVIAAGANPDKIALLDNFCWCDALNPERLYQLKQAARGCYDAAVEFGAPFISGKDSMFNDFRGFDENGKPITISIPPTLLISSIGIIDDVTKAVSLDFKVPGDLIYIVDVETRHIASRDARYGVSTGKTPGMASVQTYRALAAAIDQRLVASALATGLGGVGVALAKKSVAGVLGLTVDWMDKMDWMDRTGALFLETQGGFVVTICPQNKKDFEAIMKNAAVCVGAVTDDKRFVVKNGEKILVQTTVTELTKAYRKKFGGM